jgi:signal transduction histidine kinase
MTPGPTPWPGRGDRCVAPDSAPRRGRPEALRRVLVNLLDNALKAVHRRGGEDPGGRIEVRVERGTDGPAREGEALAPAGAWRLSVSDNGPGVPEELRDRIFERFRRGEPAREREGARGGWGLGLAIALRIAEAHGGRIELSEAPGGGARFTLILPDPPGA